MTGLSKRLTGVLVHETVQFALQVDGFMMNICDPELFASNRSPTRDFFLSATVENSIGREFFSLTA
jgi:hypothetical protein